MVAAADVCVFHIKSQLDVFIIDIILLPRSFFIMSVIISPITAIRHNNSKQISIHSIMYTSSISGHPLHNRRWSPVNTVKNSNVTIQIVCSWSGKRFNVPSASTDHAGITFDNNDENQTALLGSTTLLDLIQRVKKDIPGLYLIDEVGAGVLVCGPNHVFQSDWKTTMICDLIRDTKKKVSSRITTNDDNSIPRVMLEDGREAVVITIGTPESIPQTKPTVIQRCLAKGDVYG